MNSLLKIKECYSKYKYTKAICIYIKLPLMIIVFLYILHTFQHFSIIAFRVWDTCIYLYINFCIKHEIQNPAYEPETRTQQDCKNVRKIGLILQKHFHILHYSSDLWAAASLEEDSSLGPEMTNQRLSQFIIRNLCLCRLNSFSVPFRQT